MPLYRIYYKMTWYDATIDNSYLLIAAYTKDEARKKAKLLLYEGLKPTSKAKVSLRTSFKGFIK